MDLHTYLTCCSDPECAEKRKAIQENVGLISHNLEKRIEALEEQLNTFKIRMNEINKLFSALGSIK